MALDISVFISCYNEETSLIRTIETVVSALNHANLSWEILVIDDCSDDHSFQVFKTYVKNHTTYNISYRRKDVNQGLAKSVYEAAGALHGKYFWLVGADNQVPRAACDSLLNFIGKKDLIIPYVKKYRDRALLRCFLSVTFAFLVRICSGCSVRYYNGAPIFQLEQFVADMENVPCGFAYPAEHIIRQIEKGCSYIEVSVEYVVRQDGKSTSLSYKHLCEVTLFLLRMLRKRVGTIFLNIMKRKNNNGKI